MSRKIYVGNYPLSFIEDDVLNLFQDYEGVEFAGFFRNNKKCYSFLHCTSERQLIEIVANLHDIDVCGRNLIVRAVDENLQKRIQKSISKYGEVNFHPKNTCDVNSSTSVYGNNGIFGQSESRPSKKSSSPQMVNSYDNKNTCQPDARSSKQSSSPQMVNSYSKNTCQPDARPSKQSSSPQMVNSYSKNTCQPDARPSKQSSSPQMVNSYSKNTCQPDARPSKQSSSPQMENSYSKNTCQSDARPSKQSSLPQMSNSCSKNTYPKKYEMDTSAGHSTMPNTYNNSQQNEGISKNYEGHDYSSRFSESNYSSRQNSYYAQNSFSGGKEKSGSSYCQNLSECERKIANLDINPQETFSRFSKSKTDASGHHKTIGERFDSYKTNPMHNREDSSSVGHRPDNLRKEYQTRNRNASESSLETVHNLPHSQEYESLSFVSVINFPLFLPIRDLYRLFADFNPIKVFIVCNEPRTDKTPTEAIICFQHEKEATDAILTLDNTVYRGRILIVTDAVDMSLVSELLSFQ